VKLSEYKQSFYQFSGKASDVTRAAALGGIALVWVFKVEGKPIPCLPADLLRPAAFFAGGLGLDVMQYVIGALTWGSFHRYHERRLTDPAQDPELSHPPWLVWPINGLFVLKIVTVVWGYVLLGQFLSKAWFAGIAPGH
jgi:hypothetical protein